MWPAERASGCALPLLRARRAPHAGARWRRGWCRGSEGMCDLVTHSPQVDHMSATVSSTREWVPPRSPPDNPTKCTGLSAEFTCIERLVDGERAGDEAYDGIGLGHQNGLR